MVGQLITGAKKDYWASFSISLVDYPFTCKITNMAIFGELLSEKSILVFGKYDLIFCCKKGGYTSGYEYENTIISRTFCENISLARPIKSESVTGDVEVRTCFSRPLRVNIREGRPVNLTFLDHIKNLLSCKRWVEVYADGEISAEVVRVQEMPASANTDKNSDDNYITDDQSAQNYRTQYTDRLAETKIADVPDNYRKKERDKASHSPIEREVNNVPDKKEETLAGEFMPGHPITVDSEVLTSLVMKIIEEYEKGKRKGVDRKYFVDEQKEEKREKDNSAQISKEINHTTVHSVPLEKIPSRPGLYKTIILNAPPSKPPDRSE